MGLLSCACGDNDSTKVEMAEAACIDIDVTHRQTAMIVAIRLEEFKIPRVIRHSYFAAKLRRTSRRCVQRFGERALETKQRAPTRHADINDLARGIGELIDTEVSGNCAMCSGVSGIQGLSRRTGIACAL